MGKFKNGLLFGVTLFFLQCMDVSAKRYRFGLLMVNDSKSNRFDLQHIGPAIDIASEKCRANYNVEVELIPGYYPHRCSEVQAIGKATDITTDYPDIVAFVGPACSDDVQVVGRYATYKNIPIITGLGDVLKERDEFTTLIRMSYDLKDKARAILAFLGNFGWRYFGMIYRFQDIYYGTLAEELMRMAQKRGFEITCKLTYVRAPNKTVVTDMYDILERMKLCAR
ncbi:uncharacterized protein LOC106476621, partial [Limulus polyphemus]|uniref:Uncharacterized protein LOC106476621 n=1 Tax=Limulus polyphemus TaxID=6850 RepID=A0ABM1C1S2_LIMPO